jgi:PAS domain S-box-containing protein
MIDQRRPIIAHGYAFIFFLMQETESNSITTLTQMADNDFWWLQIAAILLLSFSVLLFLSTLYFYQLEHQKRKALEQVVSEVQVAIYEWEIEENLLIWVSGLMETFGYSESDIEPTVDWWVTQLHPDDKRGIHQALQAAIKNKQNFSEEYRFRNADNRYLDIRGRASIISETPLRLVGSMEDVTEYKWAERALRQQSTLYKALLQAQSDLGEGVATIEDEKIIYTNTALCHITNYTLEEIMSLPSFFDLMPPQERQKQRQAWQKRLMGKQTANFFETVIVRRDGRQIDLEMAVKEIAVDKRRQFILICRDITRRKRASAALRESERKYSELVREAPDAIISLNQNGVIQVFNPAAERMSGYEATVMIGKRLAEQRLVAAPYLPKLEQEVDLVLNRRERAPFELELVWQDGWRLTVEANPRRIQRNGQIIGVQLTLRDISERKAFEEQLAHHVFHDPLTGLPNRTLFRDRVDRALARTRRADASIGVLVLDLDRFKVVNDSLGHSVGDQLLIKMARRLQECVQPEDTVARLGGG